ncbi:MAG: DUF4126 family protein [Acidobacteria bacterium]|nr:DUF4126 family protein [Acidobacteriota bacterium]
MEDIVSYLTAFGLATGAGTKATIPVVALGLFHYTPYFELSPQWAWIASPPVLAVLIVMLVVELWADAHPELGAWSDRTGYLPTIVSGFIAFAASTGEIDSSLLQLAASGLLGSGTAVGVRMVRNFVRRPLRDHVESTHHGVGNMATASEAAFAGAVSSAAFLAPLVAGILALGAIVVAAGLGAVTREGKIACPKCGAKIDPRALVCASCRAEVGG